MGIYYKGMPKIPSGAKALLRRVAREARECRFCEDRLLHPPRPVFRAGETARLLIVGQAPGRRVHETGIPWNDPSGDVLREWLHLDRGTFYDESRIAIVPVGLCYPGTVDGVDLPPCAACAPRWQPRFREALPQVALTLLVGSYAQAYYLGARRKASVAETVRAWQEYLPEFFVLPHPSWRNKGWIARNPWFSNLVIPSLRRRVGAILRTV
jgi:uracil-DNA glycosylase